MLHKPVLLKETLELLDLKPGQVVVDGTLGSGGHSEAILEKIGPGGKLIAIDQDPGAIARCKEKWPKDPRVTFQAANFSDIEIILKKLNISGVDAVLVDVGISSDQLDNPERGFSFDRDGPLDMRMNPDAPVSARDLVSDLSQDELERIFREYGEERFAGRFARVICEERLRQTIDTTHEFVQVLSKALPYRFEMEKSKRPYHQRRHFATRIFQALRIAVNDELKNLEKGLQNFWNQLNYDGRIAVITFHSLEDRIVKNFFREKKVLKTGLLLNKKPIIASRDEQKENPRSRSAKLRGIKKI